MPPPKFFQHGVVYQIQIFTNSKTTFNNAVNKIAKICEKKFEIFFAKMH